MPNSIEAGTYVENHPNKTTDAYRSLSPKARAILALTDIAFLTGCVAEVGAIPAQQVVPTEGNITQSTLVVPPPTETPFPTPTLKVDTSTVEPTQTSTSEPSPTATATEAPLPPELAGMVSKLTEAQRASLETKAEDTKWKIDVYNAIKEGSPNLKLTLDVWENPGMDNDVEVVYRLPTKPNYIYFPGAKLQENHLLPPSVITQEMMDNQEVVTWFAQVVTSEMEKSSGVPAGSKLARVNGDLAYLSDEGVEAKLNVETGIFEQQVVRDEEDWVPLEGGTRVKLDNIKKIPNDGTFVFSKELDGTQPFPEVKYQLPVLPDGYEYTAFTFICQNPLGNGMTSWSKNVTKWFVGEHENQFMTKTLRSDDGDSWARLVIMVPHKVGNDVAGVGVVKTGGAINHLVFREDDPVTKDLLPQ